VAGMGADLFESYIGSIIRAEILGGNNPHLSAVPMWHAAGGLISPFIGFFFVSIKEKGDGWNTNLTALMLALTKGMYLTNVYFLVFAAVIVILLYGANSEVGWKMVSYLVMGLWSGMVIGKAFSFSPLLITAHPSPSRPVPEQAQPRSSSNEWASAWSVQSFLCVSVLSAL